jgi:prenyl protein peptidase
MGKTNRALKNALFSSLFQFVYTTIFGWYASYLFLRLESLWPPVFVHSFCNIMGFPDFNYINHRPPMQKSGKKKKKEKEQEQDKVYFFFNQW